MNSRSITGNRPSDDLIQLLEQGKVNHRCLVEEIVFREAAIEPLLTAYPARHHVANRIICQDPSNRLPRGLIKKLRGAISKH